MEILVSAYGCEPNKGSEPGIGWRWCTELAKFGKVTVITRSNNRDNIEAGISVLPIELTSQLEFYYYDTDEMIRKVKKGDHNLYLYYFFWQVGAYKMAKELCRHKNFDLCIALTFGSIWMPTFMYKLDVPFVWGPIGGGEAIPNEYLTLFGKKSALLQKCRKLMAKTIQINPLVSKPLRAAKFIVARTQDTANIIPGKYQSKLKICLETAIDVNEIKCKDYDDNTIEGKVKFIYTGRLIPIKGLRLVFEAIGQLDDIENIEFTLIGDGAERSKLERLADQLNIRKCIRFRGKMDRKDLLTELEKSDVFIFPSFKEGGSWALMEAMSSELPVICLDTSGMHLITDEDCAIRIPIGTVEDTIMEYAKAIQTLANNREMRETFGKHARKRIEEEFVWAKKYDFLSDEIFLVK